MSDEPKVLKDLRKDSMSTMRNASQQSSKIDWSKFDWSKLQPKDVGVRFGAPMTEEQFNEYRKKHAGVRVISSSTDETPK